MSKLTNICIISFLLLISHATAARTGPAFSNVTPMKTHNKEEIGVGKVEIDENCSGVGEEECLMRRTLAAHIDYIYTQGNKHN